MYTHPSNGAVWFLSFLSLVVCVSQTQTAVRVYNLAKQELARKLQTGVRWVSCMDIHGQG